jgi:hypothetical protein
VHTIIRKSNDEQFLGASERRLGVLMGRMAGNQPAASSDTHEYNEFSSLAETKSKIEKSSSKASIFRACRIYQSQLIFENAKKNQETIPCSPWKL